MRLRDLLLAVLSVCLICAFGCAKSQQERQLKTTTDGIEIVMEGMIEPIQEAQIVAPTSEKVKAVYVKNGAKVLQGEVVADYDIHELKTAYNRAQIDYEKARISTRYEKFGRVDNAENIANAKERVVKTYELYKTDNASLSELKSAEDAYLNIINAETNARNAYRKEEFQNSKARSEAMKDVERARLEVEKARYNLANGRIVAGFSGFVTNFDLYPGKSVSQGDLIGRIIDIDNINLKGNFSPGMVKYLKVDMPVNISCVTTPPYNTKGVIKRIFPVIDSKTKRMTIDIPLKNENYLLQPGDKCMISINMSKKEAETAGIATEEKKAFVGSAVK